MSTFLGNEISRIAADLAHADVQRLQQLGGGRNSRVFRVDTAAGPYALKLYPPPADDQRDRLAVETAALRWMESRGFTMVPRVIAADRDRDAVLLSWAEGDLVRDSVGEAEITQACDFLRLLHSLRGSPAVSPDYLAAEACLSVAEIERQLRSRIASLRSLDERSLTVFLDEQAEPEMVTRLDRARTAMAAAGGAFEVDLPQSGRSQVPSDFGFHNALRRADGRLTFIDFEYFGWDDPAKLVADILLHPGTPIDDDARARLHSGALGIYGDDPGFAARLNALLPLFGLRWALILLNEFRPERWQRRVMAGASETWASAKQRQLAAARLMLDRHAASRRTG
jgi:Ser/Thr protein kinase RdoA (MazF antagonist)